MINAFNPLTSDSRRAVIINGRAHFTRRSYAVACIKQGEFLHLESFYGNDGRAVRAKALRYMKKYLSGSDCGLSNPLHRMAITSGFNSKANLEAIEALRK